MLETESHQAAGLSVLACDDSPRIVAVVSHGDARSELPLLWQLCAAWSALDYPVAVLDAHLAESDARPGLAHLLLDREDSRPLDRAVREADWPIQPAALGLAELAKASPAQPPLDGAAQAQRLCDTLHGYELIVLYAPASVLSRTLRGSVISPLLPVSGDASALISAYHALKQLLNLGRLRPTILSVMGDSSVPTRVSGHGVSRNLQDCARDFLACEVPALTLDPERTDEMRGLALRTLEQALRPQEPALGTPSSPMRISKRH